MKNCTLNGFVFTSIIKSNNIKFKFFFKFENGGEVTLSKREEIYKLYILILYLTFQFKMWFFMLYLFLATKPYKILQFGLCKDFLIFNKN